MQLIICILFLNKDLKYKIPTEFTVEILYLHIVKVILIYLLRVKCPLNSFLVLFSVYSTLNQ